MHKQVSFKIFSENNELIGTIKENSKILEIKPILKAKNWVFKTEKGSIPLSINFINKNTGMLKEYWILKRLTKVILQLLKFKYLKLILK